MTPDQCSFETAIHNLKKQQEKGEVIFHEGARGVDMPLYQALGLNPEIATLYANTRDAVIHGYTKRDFMKISGALMSRCGQIKYKGLTIEDLRNCSLLTLSEMFRYHPALRKLYQLRDAFRLIQEVPLGRNLSTLSSTELLVCRYVKMLYAGIRKDVTFLFESPTREMEFGEIEYFLWPIFKYILDRGARVIVWDCNPESENYFKGETYE